MRKGKRPPRPPIDRSDDRRHARPAGAAPLRLYGQHAVAAAVANPARRLRRLLATAAALERLRAAASLPHGLYVETMERPALDALLPDGAVHQGLVLETAPLEPPALEDLIAGSAALIVVLDQVTDPQNVGSILRSAAAFGAAALVVTEQHAPPETGALVKAASGAFDHVPLLRVVNLARALDMLKDGGFWCVGLAGESESLLAEARLDGRVALILGAEGDGLRRLTRERCDILARLPTGGPVAALNVATAAAVALYEVARRRGRAAS
ncbi:MAG: 23S rRNA (guanosine(2251)-2'-O)-methyltransferase RlmB [Alphaproteobacteria bacterium]